VHEIWSVDSQENH